MVTEKELIKRMREGGKAYLRRKPKAFGGGIDPETGIRRDSSGKRVSVTSPTEEAAGVKKITIKEVKPQVITPAPKLVAQRIAPADTVTINGLGYSVRPAERERFIKSLKTKPTRRKGDWLSPELVKYGYDWAATQTLRTGTYLASKAEKGLIKLGVSPKSRLFKPTPLTGRQAKEIISSFYTFSTFSPFIKTGTAQRLESQYADEVVEVIYKGKKVKMSLSQARSLGLEPVTRRAAVGEFGRASQERQLEILKKAFRGVGGEKRVYLDKASLMKDVRLATKFMKEAGLTQSQIKARINTLFPGLMKPEVSTVIKATTRGGVVADPFAPTTTAGGQLSFIQPAQMERLAEVATASKTAQSLFQPSKVGQVNWQISSLFSSSLSGQDTLQQSKAGQDVFAATSQLPKTTTKQTPRTRFAPPKTTFAPPTFAPPKTTFAPPKVTFRPGRPTTPQKPGVPKLVPFGLPKVFLPSTQKKQQGWMPSAKTRGGKWKRLSKKPMTRQAALGRMAYAMDNTTSAQGRIRKAKGKPIAAINNYFGKTSHKYRPYKKVKGRPIRMHNQWIEKRGSRIDTQGEKAGLSLAKLSKNMGWFGQKKKSKKKSPWLI